MINILNALIPVNNFASSSLDINECTTNADDCDPNAFCTDTNGSFNCTCDPAYTGNGTSCTGEDNLV